jgi:hypothetical protein
VGGAGLQVLGFVICAYVTAGWVCSVCCSGVWGVYCFCRRGG